jgi:hypothetical protein
MAISTLRLARGPTNVYAGKTYWIAWKGFEALTAVHTALYRRNWTIPLTVRKLCIIASVELVC